MLMTTPTITPRSATTATRMGRVAATYLMMIAALLFITPAAIAQSYDDDDEIVVTEDDGEEEVIDVPEGLTHEVDSLLSLYYSRMYLSPDDNCQYRSDNPSFSDKVYSERLSRLPNIMEMSYNQVVRKFIERYATRLRSAVGYWLGASNFYMPIFEQALESYNMPLELRYLPVIESGLNPNAVSRVGATGLWQFMLVTGKQYGLKVNSLVDERRDPIKASYAAAHYLRDLYKIFGDWNLVIAAYNCGPENINRAIHRAGGERDYWKIYPYLPRETRGYVPAFIAANYIMNYYCEHYICPMRTKLPAKSDTVVVSRDVHLEQIAAVCHISLDELRTLNPQYRRDIVNGSSEPSAIRLPDEYINAFIDNESAIYAYRADELLTRRAVVDVNETQVETPRRSHSYSRRSASSHSRRGATYGKSRHSRNAKWKAGSSKRSKGRGTVSSKSKHGKAVSSKRSAAGRKSTVSSKKKSSTSKKKSSGKSRSKRRR